MWRLQCYKLEPQRKRAVMNRSVREKINSLCAIRRRTPALQQAFSQLEVHLRVWFVEEPHAVTLLELLVGTSNLRLLYDVTGGKTSETLNQFYGIAIVRLAPVIPNALGSNSTQTNTVCQTRRTSR